ncbi:MAG: glutamyl-tRNA reductase [Phycisphaerales bacterium]|nr:glutamyl-tRNA reductase [Phycisphaerales bacterium]
MTPRIRAISISHKTAPIALRERIAVDDVRAAAIVRRSADYFGEAVFLRTCGRLELYVATDREFQALAVLENALGVPAGSLRDHARALDESAATDHLLKVASGLLSPLPGEYHILGQARDAFTFAQSHRATGPLLSALFRAAIHTGKRVRTETAIGRLAQTYAAAALGVLRSRLKPHSRILIVGSGTLAGELARDMRAAGQRDITIASRHQRRGRELAIAIRGAWRPMDALGAALSEADIVVCCTSSRSVLVTPSNFPTDERDRVVLDLGMPRNVDATIEQHGGVALIHLDDLRSGASLADECVRDAGRIIREESARFHAWCSRRRAYYAEAAA